MTRKPSPKSRSRVGISRLLCCLPLVLFAGSCTPNWDALKNLISTATRAAAERAVIEAALDPSQGHLTVVGPDTQMITEGNQEEFEKFLLRGASEDGRLTINGQYLNPPDERFIEAVQDYFNQNRTSAPVSDFGSLSRSIRVVTKNELKGIFDSIPKSGWREFQHLFPGAEGLLYVSRPGISSDGSLAVVSIRFTNGAIEAVGSSVKTWQIGESGRFKVMELKDGIWAECSNHAIAYSYIMDGYTDRSN